MPTPTNPSSSWRHAVALLASLLQRHWSHVERLADLPVEPGATDWHWAAVALMDHVRMYPRIPAVTGRTGEDGLHAMILRDWAGDCARITLRECVGTCGDIPAGAPAIEMTVIDAHDSPCAARVIWMAGRCRMSRDGSAPVTVPQRHWALHREDVA